MMDWLRRVLAREEAASYCRVYTRYKTTLSGYLLKQGREGLVLKTATVAFEDQLGGESTRRGW